MLNYDEVYDELQKSQKLLTREIRKINEKNDLTPQELNSMKEAVCLMEKLIELDSMIDSSYSAYAGDSEYDYDSRRMSNARGRSPRTGRYVSRRSDGNMMGMSRHSIEDRMIAALEDQMDSASTDYERKMVGDWISKIRAAEMK